MMRDEAFQSAGGDACGPAAISATTSAAPMHQSILETSATGATPIGSNFQVMSNDADISPGRVLDSGSTRAAHRSCLVQRYSGPSREKTESLQTGRGLWPELVDQTLCLLTCRFQAHCPGRSRRLEFHWATSRELFCYSLPRNLSAGSAHIIIALPKKIRDQVQHATMTYQAIDRIFYLLTGLSFALGLALALSFLLG
jgi:hypothetical protein